MYNKFLKVILVVIFCYSFDYSSAQNKNFDYENWTGKNENAKNNIEIPEQLMSNYNAILSKGSNPQSFFYKVSIDDNDKLKTGRFQACVFLSSEDAQLGLVNFLNELTTANKPPRLTNEDYIVGDVAFGTILNGTLFLIFTRNNVMVFLHAETNKAKEIALEFDKLIVKSPDWNKAQTKPSFNMKIN